MKMALVHPGFVQKVMEKVMLPSWAVRRDKVTQKSQTQRSQVVNERPDSALSPPLKGVLGTGHPQGVYPTPWLGLLGLTVTPDVAQAMNFATDQQGVLVEQVQRQGPADRAHLREGSQAFVSNGHRRLIGGDVIVALDGQPVSRLKDMQTFLQQAQPGQTVTLTLLQGKEQIQVRVTLVRGPASILSPSLAMMLQHRSSSPAQPPAPRVPSMGMGRTPLKGGDSDLGAIF
jgi:predicted metalloprotease with PDZ domain